MKVRIKGKDGGQVVCYINPENFDPERMTKEPGVLYGGDTYERF